ncbi:CpaF family protein [Candidatus Micrarchaeota archaeon]|nr:CpaF family protein [Candidatus Micrarchaeota archaeon]
MEQQVEATLFGWRISPSSDLGSFRLSDQERRIAITLLCRFFSTALSIEQLVSRLSGKKQISKQSLDNISFVCKSLIMSTGPLEAVLAQEIEEVALCQGPVRVFANGSWRETGLELTTQDHLFHVVNKLAAPCGKRLAVDTPVLNAFLPGFRIHAVSPPLSPSLQVSIRKLRDSPFSIFDLSKQGLLSGKAAEFLAAEVPSSPLLLAGNTGSGKTTTLNALLCHLPVSDRFVFVEDVSEISLPRHGNQARLVAHGASLSSLTYEALRMRPDRLVVSEVRNGEEVKAFENALLSGGGKTCYSTFHASSAFDALRRLRLLGFKKADLDAIGLIVVQKRFDEKGKEKRKITEIAKVKNGEALLLRF